MISRETNVSAGFAIQARAGPVAGRTVVLPESPFIVGRGEAGNLRLADDYVSDAHARFEIRGGQLFLTDLDSANGTVVNGARIDAETLLQPEDLVRIGLTEFRVLAGAAGRGQK
jgi:pSer/pThr/pTyr-binding forkhead associated (FHA) protein